MNRKLKIGNAVVTITDRNYLGAGGQAAVYASGNDVVKIYHEAKDMIPMTKFHELNAIAPNNVIKPLQVAYDAKDGQPVGYTMKFLRDAEPLCKLFTKAFKQDHNVDGSMVIDLVKAMQLTVAGIHKDKCLIVDLNEMNVLVDSTLVNPLFIDTDSYQTPSHRATAIMESIRDPLVKNNQWTSLSDWFSFAVLAFQLYINIHPYHGRHPKYTPKDWRKRMEEGVSVFDPSVKLPPVCNPFTVIPKRHLDWFKQVFGKNERSVPPLPDASAPIPVPPQAVTIQGSAQFDVTEVWTLTGNIKSVMSHKGLVYATTVDSVWFGSLSGQPQQFGLNPSRPAKVLTCMASDDTPVVAKQTGTDRVTFYSLGGQEISSTPTKGFFCRNNAIYAVCNGQLVEHTFTKMGTRYCDRPREIENISALSAHTFDGVIIQDLLGKKYVTVPYAQGRSRSVPVPAMDKVRVVDARGERNVVVAVGESGGVYHRFLIVFKPDGSPTVRHEPDVAYDGINFTVLENGLIILLSATDKLELISGATSTLFDNPPLDTNMWLFNDNGTVYFCNGSSVHKIKMR